MSLGMAALVGGQRACLSSGATGRARQRQPFRAVGVRATLTAPGPTAPLQSITSYVCQVEVEAMKKSMDVLQLGQAGGQSFEAAANFKGFDFRLLEEAYDRCGEVTAEYAKTFYLGTKLMTPEKRKAIWAIYLWCRRTDELVDGPNASRISPEALDRWEQRLEQTFAGRPYDLLDAALANTVAKFPVDIQPFRDMIDGMRTDLVKKRYRTFDELYKYCYRVAGTVGLMTTPVMGVDPGYKGPVVDVYKAALSLGVANQMTNILRDVGEDARRGRIYLPLDELASFGIAEDDVMRGMAGPAGVEPRWRAFMQFQIARARDYFAQAEAGVDDLQEDARWPVWSALIIYRQILDSIEANGYDNFNVRAYVPKWKKFVYLPVAFLRAKFRPAKAAAPAAADALK